MRIAGTIQDSIVDGPGFRYVVFVQGCEKHCEGCHNPGTWELGGGSEMSTDDLISDMLSNPMTDGLTLTGGEPFLQAAQCVALAAAARDRRLNVWIYSGYTFEELAEQAMHEPDVNRLLELSDVLIDGPFRLSERTLSLKWRGSRNQRVVDVRKSMAAGAVIELT